MWKSGIPALTIASIAVLICILVPKEVTFCQYSILPRCNESSATIRYVGVFLTNRSGLLRIQNATYSGKTCLTYLCLLLIINSSDCHPNPGPRPPKYPCLKCNRAVKDSDTSICCDGCDKWGHIECLKIGLQELQHLANSRITWLCPNCESQTVISGNILQSVDISSPSKFTSISDPTADDCITHNNTRSNHPLVSKKKLNQMSIMIVNTHSVRAKTKACEKS